MLLGYFAAVLIGLSLGMIGGGGSILTVPVLVYLFKVEPLLATTYSLFIVGITSLVGSIRMYIKKLINFKAVFLFGLPSIITVFITRKFILPLIPNELFSIEDFVISKNIFLMLVFAFLMLFSAISMMKEKNSQLETEKNNGEKMKFIPLIVQGLFVGFVTGLLGAGGGFLIIPALVLFIQLPMKEAVGTSLLIIAINSIAGFLFSNGLNGHDWSLLLWLTSVAIAGILAGSFLAEKISSNILKKGFGWFVLLMGIYIIIKEIFLQ